MISAGPVRTGVHDGSRGDHLRPETESLPVCLGPPSGLLVDPQNVLTETVGARARDSGSGAGRARDSHLSAPMRLASVLRDVEFRSLVHQGGAMILALAEVHQGWTATGQWRREGSVARTTSDPEARVGKLERTIEGSGSANAKGRGLPTCRSRFAGKPSAEAGCESASPLRVGRLAPGQE